MKKSKEKNKIQVSRLFPEKMILFFLVLQLPILLFGCTQKNTNTTASGVNSASIEDTDFAPEGDFSFSFYDKAVSGKKLENAFYFQPIEEAKSMVLQKIDYSTQKKTYLCKVPNCLHNDASCPAWFSENSSGVTTILVNEKPYVVSFGSRFNPSAEGTARIAEFNDDMTQLEEKYLFKNTDELSTAFVTDDENIYFTKDSFQNPDPETGAPTRTICVYNTKEDTFITLKTIPPTQELVGAFDNTLVFRKDSDEVSNVLVPAEELDSTVISYNVRNNTETEVFTYPYVNRALVYEGKYYTLTPEWDLYCCDLRTQTTNNLLFENILTGEKVESFHSFDGIYDNNLIVRIERWDLKKSERAMYMVNLETGEFTELNNLTYYMPLYNTSYPQCIAAETEDCFLIVKDADTFPATYSDGETPIEVDVVVQEYAFILKDDFWNNNPNYIEVQ